MKKVLLFILFFSQLSMLQAGGIRFFRETITVTIADSFCTVEGIYYFKNSSLSNRRLPVLYPFKIEQDLPYPDSVNVINLNDSTYIPVSHSKEACSFSLFLPSKRITSFKVFYKQATPARKMSYILTTTRWWNAPLVQADYYIIAPKHVKLKHLPFEKMEKRLSKGKMIYYIRKKNFLPLNNLDITWEK